MSTAGSGASGRRAVDALRAGEPWAWAELHRQCAPGLANLLAAAGVDDTDRGVGEVIDQVGRWIHGYDGPPDGLRVLVFSVARLYLAEETAEVKDRGTRPVRVAGEGWGRAEVRAVLAHVDPDQRDVLLLGPAGGLTPEEVAAVLQRDLAWVERTWRAATTTLGGIVS